MLGEANEISPRRLIIQSQNRMDLTSWGTRSPREAGSASAIGRPRRSTFAVGSRTAHAFESARYPAYTRTSSQERNECLHGVVSPLFHQPVPGVFKIDGSDVGRNQLHLRTQNCGAGLFARDGQNRHR